jgi:hypothetical protein
VDKMIQGNIISPTSGLISRRTSARIKVRGVVTLSSLDEPSIAGIYDITFKGMSFLHCNDLGVPGNEIMMDIIIYDGLTNVEFFMSEVKGRISSKACIPDPESGIPILRFGIEFLELNALHRDIIRTCFDQIV